LQIYHFFFHVVHFILIFFILLASFPHSVRPQKKIKNHLVKIFDEQKSNFLLLSSSCLNSSRSLPTCYRRPCRVAFHTQGGIAGLVIHHGNPVIQIIVVQTLFFIVNLSLSKYFTYLCLIKNIVFIFHESIFFLYNRQL
jgi:hypothetical protein